MNNPRTKDTQPVPSRPAKSHHTHQRAAKYTISGQDMADHFAEYVTVVYPDTPQTNREHMVKVLLYCAKRGLSIPTPNEMNTLFDGLITTESTIPLNSRQNG